MKSNCIPSGAGLVNTEARKLFRILILVDRCANSHSASLGGFAHTMEALQEASDLRVTGFR